MLRLRPLPRSQNTALVAIADFDRLWQFLQFMDSALGGTLSAFEVMWNDFYTLIIGDGSRHGRPLDTDHAFYVLIESTGSDQEKDAARFENTLQQAFEEKLALDAVIAHSKQQSSGLWAIRDDIEGLVKGLHPPITYDVSLSIPQMQPYVDEVRSKLLDQWPDAKMVTFGHLGDGNIHLVLTVGSLGEEAVRSVERIVYEALGKRQGVVSAEHGIGLEKRPYLRQSRSEEEIALMRTLKKALDPKNILNPGKILESI